MATFIIIIAVIVIILCGIGFLSSMLVDALIALGHIFMAIFWVFEKLSSFLRRSLKNSKQTTDTQEKYFNEK